MAITNPFQAHSVNYYDGGNNYLGGVTQMNIAAGTTIETKRTGTSIYPSSVTLQNVQPTCDLTVEQLAQWLDVTDLQPLCFDGTDRIELYQARRDCAGIAAGTVHRNYSIESGILHPQQLTANHQQDATMQFQLAVGYDGTNEPIVPTDGVVLPDVPDDTARWRMHTVEVGGLTLTCKKSIEINWGVSLLRDGCDNEAFDSFVGAQEVAPVITLTGVELGWIDVLAEIATAPAIFRGKPALLSDTFIRLKRVGYGIADPEHIIIAANGLITPENVLTSNVTDLSSCSIKINTAIDSGGNSPLVILTGVVLPA